MEQYKLYGGKVILKFDEKNHIYSINGKVVYGVTSIINVLSKPALLYWAVNMAIGHLQTNLQPGKVLDEVQIKTLLEGARKAHTVRRDKSADIGTMIHNWIEKYVRARIEKKSVPERPINKEMKNAIDGFFNWAKKNKVQLIDCEQKIYSKKYKYAGTYDLEAIVNGKRTIIDFKTGKAIYPEMFLQASAYLQAREEEKGEKYDGGVAILRLSQEDKEKAITPFEVQQVSREEVQSLIKVFRCCLGVYIWRMNLKKQEIINNNK